MQKHRNGSNSDVLGIDRTETENRNCTYGLLHELLAKPPQMVRHDGPTNPLKFVLLYFYLFILPKFNLFFF